MNKDVIGLYDTFNTKVFPNELIFGDFNYQPIPSNYYNLLNDDDEDGNNVPSNTVEDDIPENKGVEYSVIPNNEDIND